jgi:catechol 2,3-dioxygenase-like lactoylglutathione lyase family enzyme
MISHIHSTTIVVADQDAALDFYVNTLGWEKALDNQVGPGERFLTVVPPAAKTELVLGLPTEHNTDPRGKYSGITLIAPDIDATYETLSQRGVEFKQPVAEMPWGARATWFSDPDGNEFFLTNG